MQIVRQSLPFRVLAERLDSEQVIRLDGIAGSSAIFIAAELYDSFQKPLFMVFPTENEAKQFYEDVCEIIEQACVVFYPALKHQMWSEIGPSRTDVGRRISALKEIRKNHSLLIITTVEALIEKIADPEDVELYSLVLTPGSRQPFHSFIRQLVEMGFCREERTDYPGEFSVRGGIVDIFLFEENDPFRIEFFDDEIESIRRFNAETQRSIDPSDSVEILPLACAGPYAALNELTQIDLPFTKTIVHYLSPDYMLWLNEELLVNKTAQDYQKEIDVHFERKQHEKEAPLFHDRLYSSYEEIAALFNGFKKIAVSSLPSNLPDTISFGTRRTDHFGGNPALFKAEIDEICTAAQNPFIVMACDSEAQTKRLQELFIEEGFAQDIHISTLNLSNGFLWPESNTYIYTSRDLYSRIRLPKLDKLQKRSVSYREELSIHRGDFVVHNDFGIGIFQGLEKIKAYGKICECLTIEYKDGDKVFVPLEKMDQVQKYSSHDAAAPVLNKLGTIIWEKLKTRTRQRMMEIAQELIKLYATRKMRAGYAFSEDTVWQKELEASFQFEETIDQLAAINDVKADMAAPSPMDRLVCGDVGYGKTEVAVRAAFKAIAEGKQAAVLVPTTILASQHLTTFTERMKNYPVKIEMLSRFKSPKEQKETLKKLAAGEIDLIIGTHRLLSKDVVFKDLGLLVVDEEQRFGVIHKEKIKMIKQSVDTLVMSATPIPRTMHMAMIGAKDMSIINSPPNNRLPIKTEVSRFDPELIREAILHELDRGGQVFFVHNRIQSIYGIAARIRELVPEASVAVAHGQMKAHELEEVMLKFVGGTVQVLVSTMIIENGIDMPRANTLIINRADKFGLAQLYQLRGRVGRSDQQAFAYLLIPPLRKLTHDAIKRLQTIQEYSALGAGYKIAMRDLEIRGAGNIFGAEQTGFVNALGYELYSQIIQEAIRELKQELNLEPAVEQETKEFDSKVECAVDAYIPDNYVTSTPERVDIYRRLVQAGNVRVIEEIKSELADRFGALPEKAQNLFDYLTLKVLASKLKLAKVVLKDHTFIGEFDYQSIPTGSDRSLWLNKLIAAAPDSFEIKDQRDKGKLAVELRLPRGHSALLEAKKFLQSIN